MEPYATVADLLAGWPGKELSGPESESAAVLLARASAQLSALLAGRGIAVDADDEVQSQNLKTVACNMVRRAMATPGADGVASMSQGIGATTASVTWNNPDGAFYLSKLDRDILGLRGGSAYRAIHAQTAELGVPL